MEERIQKIIAAAGIMSRRAAEEAIIQGRVEVNGNAVSLGDKADPEKDVLSIDGIEIQPTEQMIYIALNKPKGYVTTMHDEQGRKTVCELVADIPYRVIPVGRLDLNSEGLLLMTNDGTFTNRVLHPSMEFEKVYEVVVKGERIEKAADELKKPMVIDDVPLRPAKVRILMPGERRAVLQITIHEGKNRQVRKMCKAVGLDVVNLKRVQEGNVSLGKLKTGEWRYLTEQEVRFFLKG